MLDLWFNDNDCLSIVLYSAFGVCYPQWCGHIRITGYSAWLWKGSQGRNCIEELMPTPPSILITMKLSHAQDGVRGLIYLGQWTAILGGSVSQPSGPPWIPSLRGLTQPIRAWWHCLCTLQVSWLHRQCLEVVLGLYNGIQMYDGPFSMSIMILKLNCSRIPADRVWLRAVYL